MKTSKKSKEQKKNTNTAYTIVDIASSGINQVMWN
jgi:hypothetical protein